MASVTKIIVVIAVLVRIIVPCMGELVSVSSHSILLGAGYHCSAMHTVLRDSRTMHAIIKAKFNRAASKGYFSVLDNSPVMFTSTPLFGCKMTNA